MFTQNQRNQRSGIYTANFLGSLLTSKLLICTSVLYIAIHNAKHPIIWYTLIIIPLCVCGPPQGGGGSWIGDGGISVNFNYNEVLIKLQTKYNTNWPIMIMFALESIPQPSSYQAPIFLCINFK